MNTLTIENGKKFSEFGVKPSLPSISHPPRIIATSSSMFLIILQADWTRRELKNISNSRIVFDVANINDVIDIVITMGEELEFDVAYNVNLTASEIQFQEINEGEGVGFHIILVAPDTTVLYQRLISLNTDLSNDFIHTLLEVKEKNYTKEAYNKKIMQLYNEMTVKEIKKNAFIHQNSFKRR